MPSEGEVARVVLFGATGYTGRLTAEAMAAFLQNKQGDQASELLDALQGAGGNIEKSVATMQQLVAAIQTQMEALAKEGKKAEADELGRSFAEFLALVKSSEGDAGHGVAPAGTGL